MLVLALLVFAAAAVGALLRRDGGSLLASWIVEVTVLAGAVAWYGYADAGSRRLAGEREADLERAAADLRKAAGDLADERARHAEAIEGRDADQERAAADLAAERARHAEVNRRLGEFLAVTKLDGDLGQAAADLAAERARHAETSQKIGAFLAAGQLDGDLVKAAADLAAERARRAEADRRLGEFLAATGLDGDLMKAAADLAAERAQRGVTDRSVASFLLLTGLDADLLTAAADLAAERARRAEAEQRLAAFLASTGLDADLEKAAADLADERAWHAEAERGLATFLAGTGLGDGLEQAAAEVAAERAQYAEAERGLAAFLTHTGLGDDLVQAAAKVGAEREQYAQVVADLESLREATKEAADLAAKDQRALSTTLEAANLRIVNMEEASRQAALDRETTTGEIKKFWTADQSIRVLMSPLVPTNSHHSCVVPRKDGSVKVRLRFFVANASPYKVTVTGVRFNFSAIMDAFQVSGEYSGPPGEQQEAVVTLAPWGQSHFLVRAKGTLANPGRFSEKSTRVACLYLHDSCYVTVKGHWERPQRAPFAGDTDYILVSWEEFR